MRQEEEVILIDEIINGNVNAFRKIVEKYEDMVFTITLRIIRNREMADEIAQDVFLKVYQSINKFKGKSKLSTWIYKIAYNTSVNATRGLKNSYGDTDIESIPDQRLGSSPDAQFELIAEDSKQMVKRAIMSLDESESIIVTLYYFDDLSVSEISDITGISKSNVKVKLYRSRNKLYELLKNKIEKEFLDYEYN